MTPVTDTEKQKMAAPAKGHTSSAGIISITQKKCFIFWNCHSLYRVKILALNWTTYNDKIDCNNIHWGPVDSWLDQKKGKTIIILLTSGFVYVFFKTRDCNWCVREWKCLCKINQLPHVVNTVKQLKCRLPYYTAHVYTILDSLDRFHLQEEKYTLSDRGNNHHVRQCYCMAAYIST